MKVSTKIFIALFSLMIVGFMIGMFLFNKKVPGLEGVKPDYVLTSDELFNAFEVDETAATEKYAGKVLEVTGELVRIKTEENQSNLILKADNAIIGGVNCSFNQPLDSMVKGKMITIKGRCQGFLMDVVLNNCTLE